MKRLVLALLLLAGPASAASLAVGNITRDSGPGCDHLTAPVGITHRTLTNGSMTNGSAALNSTGAGFAQTDVGRVACVRGAAASSGLLCSVVIARPSTTQLTLAQAAGATVSGAVVQLLTYVERTDAAMTNGSSVLTSAGATFTQGDEIGSFEGRRIAVGGAGAAGAVFVATVVEVLNDTQLQLSANAATTVSNQTARIARHRDVKTTVQEQQAPVTEEDLAAALKVWGKLASADGKTIAQMEGHTVVAAVP